MEGRKKVYQRYHVFCVQVGKARRKRRMEREGERGKRRERDEWKERERKRGMEVWLLDSPESTSFNKHTCRCLVVFSLDSRLFISIDPQPNSLLLTHLQTDNLIRRI